jgi:hypothetical protein
MRPSLSGISLFFAAGVFGALVNSLVVWASGDYGITAAYGISIAPKMTPGFLYPRLVWGGLWGLAFFIPLRYNIFLKGLLLSLMPSLVMLFIVFPYQKAAGTAGMDLGRLTPLFVLIVNAVWGLSTALWIKLAR